MKLDRHFGWSGSASLRLRQPAQKGFEHHRRLDPGKLGTQAEVDAAAEGQRTQVLAGDVEPVGVFEHRRDRGWRAPTSDTTMAFCSSATPRSSTGSATVRPTA